MEAPLRVTPSKHRSGINNLTEDISVLNSSNGGKKLNKKNSSFFFSNILF